MPPKRIGRSLILTPLRASTIEAASMGNQGRSAGSQSNETEEERLTSTLNKKIRALSKSLSGYVSSIPPFLYEIPLDLNKHALVEFRSICERLENLTVIDKVAQIQSLVDQGAVSSAVGSDALAAALNHSLWISEYIKRANNSLAGSNLPPNSEDARKTSYETVEVMIGDSDQGLYERLSAIKAETTPAM